jgi:AcrR family transcriptional regulator
MGRKAGVTADQTRSELLKAAAVVFARKGYDGASIADITDEAGLSSGAIYAHYSSKAELIAAVLEAHGREQFERLLRITGTGDVADFVTTAGASFDRRPPGDVAMVLEVIAASNRDPEMARLVRKWLLTSEKEFADLVREGQRAGAIDASVSAVATARFAMMLSLGSVLTSALRMPQAAHGEWAALIARVVDSVRAPRSGRAAAMKAAKRRVP